MFLAQFLNIANGDLHYINELLEVIDDEGFAEHAQEELGYLKIDEINENSFISCIFNRINNDVFNEVKTKIEDIEAAIGSTEDIKQQVLLKKEALLETCQKNIEDFSPYINALDSHFNNELDQVGVRGRKLNDIIEDVFMALCTQYEEEFYKSQREG